MPKGFNPDVQRRNKVVEIMKAQSGLSSLQASFDRVGIDYGTLFADAGKALDAAFKSLTK